MKPVQVFAGALLALAACTPSDPPQELAQDSTQASAQAFSSDRISVVTRGTGRDLILVPGLGSHHNVWDSVAGPLEARYTLHIVQVNGFAGVAPGANVSGLLSAPVAEEIARFITATGLTRPALVGHSMGGTIGMMLALHSAGSASAAGGGDRGVRATIGSRPPGDPGTGTPATLAAHGETG